MDIKKNRIRNWLYKILAIGLICQSYIAIAQTKDSDFRITDLQARLLYEQSGTLSEDITDNNEFIIWNTIIGEGSARENANDLLITALVEGYDQHNLDASLLIIVRGADGNIIAKRTIPRMLVEPKTYRSLMLEDVGCSGILRIEARLGLSVRTEEINLPCGE